MPPSDGKENFMPNRITVNIAPRISSFFSLPVKCMYAFCQQLNIKFLCNGCKSYKNSRIQKKSVVFADRFDAGRQLADRLSKYNGSKDAIVLAIPRGGVEVGYALASQLKCPLDIVISKKIPYPGQPELAIGAVCNDVVSLDEALIEVQKIGKSYVDAEIGKLKATVKERYAELTGKRDFPQLRKKTVILTDDGIATGHTFIAAVDFLKSKKPKSVIAAIPVGPPETLEIIKEKVDELVAIEKPSFFMAVGEFYRDFEQVSDEDVRTYLSKGRSS